MGYQPPDVYKRQDKGKTKLTIPNLVVQEQLYTYLLNTYNDADLNFSSYEKSELSSQLAYDGNWQAYFGYIADCLKRYASQRDKQKGEFFVQDVYKRQGRFESKRSAGHQLFSIVYPSVASSR